MNTHEPKNKNFIILILFLVFSVSGAKTLHDINVSDAEENKIEVIGKEVAVKH